MKQIEPLEEALVKLSSRAPALPENTRKFLAKWAWLFALVGGVLSLVATWNIWTAAHFLQTICRGLAACNSSLGSLGVMFYIALLFSLAYSIIFIASAQPLKRGSKSGWDLLFLGIMVNLASVVVSMVYGGFGNMFAAIISVVIGWYFLFQIRDYFTDARGAGPSSGT